MPTFDQQDQEILNARQTLYNARTLPQSGDVIIFCDGSEARITHVWTDNDNNPVSIQTSNTKENYGFYLGDGYMSYSGGLNSSIPWKYFTKSTEKRSAPVWFFHHDYVTAHNGVECRLDCKVWNCATINRTHENWEKGLWKVGEDETK